ncbi:hypothetical protein HRI_003550300 [Hibiscus trionum]|uniref:Uncharacterized protein n=1 Tax=Hibiscus trionum TaxID=183268 RepID=A0A9W7MI65_HIBTR|nr:hypothetical protein HRI_003550300 [Hibiscus trionum]
MAAKFSHQLYLYGAFLTFILLQSFVVQSKLVELESTQNHEQGQRRISVAWLISDDQISMNYLIWMPSTPFPVENVTTSR